MHWSEVAAEMLQGEGMGAQVSRSDGWRRACEEIVRLRDERDRLRAALKLILAAVPDDAKECAVVMSENVIRIARDALDGEESG